MSVFDRGRCAKEIVETNLAAEPKDAVDNNVASVGVYNEYVATVLGHGERQVDGRRCTTLFLICTNDGDRADCNTVSGCQRSCCDTTEGLGTRGVSADRGNESWAVLGDSRNVSENRNTEVLLEFLGVTDTTVATIEENSDGSAE